VRPHCAAFFLHSADFQELGLFLIFVVRRKGPIEKYSGPATEAQEIGWFHEELVSRDI
jgi:hypothetical protein